MKSAGFTLKPAAEGLGYTSVVKSRSSLSPPLMIPGAAILLLTSNQAFRIQPAEWSLTSTAAMEPAVKDHTFLFSDRKSPLSNLRCWPLP